MLAYRAAQLTVGQLVRLVWRLDVRGAERLPEGPAVVAANHESLLDPFFLAAAFRRPLRYLAKDELFVGPLAPLLRSLGAIRVARGRGDRAAVAAGVEALRAGHAVAVFPQGSVLAHRERPWLRGAARLALTVGAPILPVCLVGSERALRPVRLRVGFPSVKVLVGEPIRVEAGPVTIAGAKCLTERVRSAVEELRAPYGPPAHVTFTREDMAASDDGAR